MFSRNSGRKKFNTATHVGCSKPGVLEQNCQEEVQHTHTWDVPSQDYFSFPLPHVVFHTFKLEKKMPHS